MLSIIYKNFTILSSMYITFELCIVYLFNIYTQNVKLIQYINYNYNNKKTKIKNNKNKK